MQQNYINHIALVLDASGSMSYKTKDIIKVADNQIKYLARRSKELDQETRVTVYSFSDRHNINCLIYDKDVLRMPSIANLYRADGQTALIDATNLVLNDLALTPEKYGEHAFLIYVLTDGQENDSNNTPGGLAAKIFNLPDHWTIAAFVPDTSGVYEAKKFGFPKENISVWDTNSAVGMAEVGEKIRETTENFMINRTKGIRGSKSLFSLATPSIQTVAKNLDNLHAGQYRLLKVNCDESISSFVESCLGRSYKLGEGFYQLTKTEEIQAYKQIAILDNKTKKLYGGVNARQLLGLPDYTVKVKPTDHIDYTIFVQSTSVNRKLIEDTRLLILS